MKQTITSKIKSNLKRFKADGLTLRELAIEVYEVGSDDKRMSELEMEMKKELKNMDVLYKKGIYYTK